jgi:phosphoglycerate-specific signal transduction histidine kinase
MLSYDRIGPEREGDGKIVHEGDFMEQRRYAYMKIKKLLDLQSAHTHPYFAATSASPTVANGIQMGLALRDYSAGLKPVSLDHLFDPFYTTKPTGMGMGLSICRSITEAHGGRLWTTANAPRDAVFQFTLHQHDAS